MTFFQDPLSRRRFLEFMGKSAVATASISPLGLLTSCAHSQKKKQVTAPFKTVAPTRADELILSEGLHYRILAKLGDTLNARGDRFGSDADYLAYLPLNPSNPDEGYLWVNHENFSPVLAGRKSPPSARTREEVIEEQKLVGGSILHIRKDGSGQWERVVDSPRTRRLTGATKIPFSGGTKIRGRSVATGTFANCAGGITPWVTLLTCEENYDHFYGERVFDEQGRPTEKTRQNAYPHGWETVFPNPPEHYGWVVEVELSTGEAKKLVPLGRFAHEAATVAVASDGRPVVYMGDDAAGHCFYKFIAARKDSLEKGTLYVANLEQGRWIPLVWKNSPELQRRFRSQLEVQTYTHLAALQAGGTPLDRPEDIERDPANGAVYVTLTNNTKKGNYHGSILKLMENGNDPLSMEFTSETFFNGGPAAGLACPDNLAFDQNGNLWVTTDMSGFSMSKPQYASFGNNGLFYIPMSGENAGRAFQIASAPIGAELTGPFFSPDQKTLFLSVQHPGETTTDITQPASRWPEGGTSLPKSAVVTITGPTLESLTQKRTLKPA